MTKLNIGLAGTPDFVIPCLDALHTSEHALSVIYTQPDRPAGRGRKLQASPVKQWAQAHAIPLQQPLNFKATSTCEYLQALQLDVLVVIAYGLILPPAVLFTPRYGCINVHASLLPRWRGASPIQHALLYGDSLSGITIMQMDRGMDTGDILLQQTYSIKANETAASLHHALANLAPSALMTVLNSLPETLDNAYPQTDDSVTYAGKITKQQAEINWHASALDIERKIRAFNPWPVTYTHTHTANQQLTVRIHQAHLLPERSNHTPGTIVHIDTQGVRIATGSADLCITQLQFAGGKILPVAEWTHRPGRQLHAGMQLQ